IGVRIELDADMIKTSVRDNGCGLPANFELGRDSGLGLTIVQQLVESDLGGHFSLRNDDGCVAAVTFPLPRRPGNRPAPVLGPEREQSIAPA
ncbi:MAG: ATP-binding protein, partial [Chloroflexota bacterium]|nr:ATP-binding protein [Chloroflexota bacterium]